MANSYTNYTGNGIKDTYVIPFGFLAKTHIQAKINTVETGDFEVAGSTIVFDTPPADGAAIKVFRVTPRRQIVEYFDGGSPRAAQKNTDSLQALYIAQEIEDGTLTGEAVIPNNSVTLTKLQVVNSGTWLGRNSANSGDVEVITTAQLKSALALGGAALLEVGTTPGTVAAGDDSRITSALQSSNVGSGLTYTDNKIVKPQAAFYAYTASATTANADVVFESNLYNYGSMYSATNGRATATIAGVYHFQASWHQDSLGADNRYGIEFYKNGVLFNRKSQLCPDGNSYQDSHSCDIPMAVNDYVTVRYLDSGTYNALYPYNNSFNGHLVYTI